ncbi:hypothetical protein DICPUDRAFT_159895 [Dictyostelium purpureum]|uniref:Uncharacterized protein n=1 Tax=Dictyostelium purpureum TaxID=5786 RepID=F1A581_DICPU|nr:uncharacterized protein DICPUDRAFT_159895 [Dictyostelium purpureum]EGC28647.1 hypothetical protein DICPUDRAFT_159895 [Dictyostelium purpureum]|eukprot:XP_003294825.1 hypothetical protein DICPUDRAFT_159895 [Dictyostelium purpureum]
MEDRDKIIKNNKCNIIRVYNIKGVKAHQVNGKWFEALGYRDLLKEASAWGVSLSYPYPKDLRNYILNIIGLCISAEKPIMCDCLLCLQEMPEPQAWPKMLSVVVYTIIKQQLKHEQELKELIIRRGLTPRESYTNRENVSIGDIAYYFQTHRFNIDLIKNQFRNIISDELGNNRSVFKFQRNPKSNFGDLWTLTNLECPWDVPSENNKKDTDKEDLGEQFNIVKTRLRENTNNSSENVKRKRLSIKDLDSLIKPNSEDEEEDEEESEEEGDEEEEEEDKLQILSSEESDEENEEEDFEEHKKPLAQIIPNKKLIKSIKKPQVRQLERNILDNFNFYNYISDFESFGYRISVEFTRFLVLKYLFDNGDGKNISSINSHQSKLQASPLINKFWCQIILTTSKYDELCNILGCKVRFDPDLLNHPVEVQKQRIAKSIQIYQKYFGDVDKEIWVFK